MLYPASERTKLSCARAYKPAPLPRYNLSKKSCSLYTTNNKYSSSSSNRSVEFSACSYIQEQHSVCSSTTLVFSVCSIVAQPRAIGAQSWCDIVNAAELVVLHGCIKSVSKSSPADAMIVLQPV
jgi:hypothetical protein